MDHWIHSTGAGEGEGLPKWFWILVALDVFLGAASFVLPNSIYPLFFGIYLAMIVVMLLVEFNVFP